MPVQDIKDIIDRFRAFEHDAHEILSSLESSKSRKITLDKSYGILDGLSIRQDEIFRQSLRCVENDLFRAAHVLAWAATIDCFHTLIASDNFIKLLSARPNWTFNSIEELSERYTEFALIEAMEVIGILGKSDKKAFQGMLSKRNECAHPSSYFPSFNETLGYISEIFSRLKRISTKYPGFQIS